VEVELESADHDRSVGTATGPAGALGDLRVAAEAALDALGTYSRHVVKFSLIGVKTLRAFDSNLVVVAVDMTSTTGHHHRLVGANLAQDDLATGVALAVLNATNRILGDIIASS
jgi:hypothetical protein